MKMAKYLKIIGRKPITYKNDSPMSKRVFLSQRQVKYVESMYITRDTEIFGMPRKEVIQLISDIGQESYYFQTDNQLY